MKRKTGIVLLAVLAVFFGLGAGLSQATCDGPVNITSIYPSIPPTVYGTFDIIGMQLDSIYPGKTTVEVDDGERSISLDYLSASGTLLDNVRLDVPPYWAGKTVTLRVTVWCNPSTYSDETQMTISDNPVQATVDFDDFTTYVYPIQENHYANIGIGSIRTDVCDDANGNLIPDCTEDNRAFSVTKTEYAASGQRVLGGADYFGELMDHSLQWGTVGGVIEFDDAIEYLSLYGKTNTSTGSGLSIDIRLYDWDNNYLGSLYGNNCEGSEGCTEDISFTGSPVGLRQHIKKIRFGGIMGLTEAYFDDLTFDSKPAGIDMFWGDVIRCYDDAGQLQDAFHIGDWVTAKVKVKIRDSYGKTFKVRLNNAKMILKGYPVGDPARIVTLVNTTNPSLNAHTKANLQNGETAIVMLKGQIPNDPALAGTEFKVQAKIHLYYQNWDGTIGDEIQKYDLEQDGWGILP
jgi:hypothetical protein